MDLHYGGRTIDLSAFPPTIGPLDRRVRFKASIQNDTHNEDFYTEVQLFTYSPTFDLVAGTILDNSAEIDRGIPTEFSSAPLVVGAAPGDVRDDVIGFYVVQFRAVGTVDPESDAAVLLNARIEISYEP